MTDDIYLADIVVSRLNRMLKADPNVMRRLVEHHVQCNGSKLRDETTAQVTACNQVGMLGILNGVCGQIKDGPRKGWGWITAVFDEDGHLLEFVKTSNLVDDEPVKEGELRGA